MNKKQSAISYEQHEYEFLIALGSSIKRLRLAKLWSQEELGFKSNLDRTYIGGIERGERNITVLNLKRIADALGVSSNELLQPYQGE